ncbi:hypothetical protein PENTCL1PPCAC_8205, partial [Pristionchus entomophagus]
DYEVFHPYLRRGSSSRREEHRIARCTAVHQFHRVRVVRAGAEILSDDPGGAIGIGIRAVIHTRSSSGRCLSAVGVAQTAT